MATKFIELESAVTPKYFYLLDIVRGFAALSVVLWHWSHFYSTSHQELAADFEVSKQPFYLILYPFYNNGLMAVDMFFLISGFVFFFLYSKSIQDKKVSFASFFSLRFSRLYPLHFLTLIIVLLLQSYFKNHNGYYFVYFFNDVYHFILNLFFATSWGLEKGPSFNGPNWSVSVEILLYVIFFIVCRYRLKKLILVFLVFFGLILQVFYAPIGHGLFSFFGGGLLYYLYLYIIKTGKQKSYLQILRIASVLFALLILFDSKYSFIENSAEKLLHHIKPHMNSAFAVVRLVSLFLRAVIFPIFLLYLVLLETLKGAKGKRLSFVGHISYSSYLLHFPLQLLLVSFFGQWIGNRESFFNSDYTFLIFFAVLIAISLLSYNYFELPMQRYLRSRWIKKKA